jgi:hypothetical protein
LSSAENPCGRTEKEQKLSLKGIRQFLGFSARAAAKVAQEEEKRRCELADSRS